MDKKNTIIGVTLLILAMYLMFTQERPLPQQPPPQRPAEGVPADPSQPAPGAPIAPVDSAAGPVAVEADDNRQGERVVSLENPLIEARFSNYGGSLREIVLKEFRLTRNSDEPYILNHPRYVAALNLITYLGDGRDVVYEVIPGSDRNSVAFRARLSDQLEVVRRYSISQDTERAAPYTVAHTLEFRNLTDQPLPMGEVYLNLGTAAPSGNQDAYLQTFGYFNNDKVKFHEQSDFLGGGFAFFKKDPKDVITGSDNVVWASLKNQFFITLITPETPGLGFRARPVQFPSESANGRSTTGITADLRLASITLPPQGTVTQSFDFYAGPKEHRRLARLPNSQEKAMQFGFFGAISKILLGLMNGLYSVVGNYGWAIVLLTVVVRGVLLPITLVSMRSMRKMSKLQEPMKALKEKFPNEPQKQQQMMMELYKLNKINPIAGCLPMLLQIPIFFALFYMLRGAAELRFAEFLWIGDLSRSDTVAIIPNVPIFGDFPLNILPFFWLISLAYQMWTMPAPSVDNAQMKLMKFMPFIFFPFTYTFSSGLVLYWTVSNVFTIGQQWLAKRNDPTFEVKLPPALKKALEGGPTKGKKSKKQPNASSKS